MKNHFKLEAWVMVLLSVVAVLAAFLAAVIIGHLHRG
jgi:MFS-type transporter involved in bile tolerance (Atg22 family)